MDLKQNNSLHLLCPIAQAKYRVLKGIDLYISEGTSREEQEENLFANSKKEKVFLDRLLDILLLKPCKYYQKERRFKARSSTNKARSRA